MSSVITDEQKNIIANLATIGIGVGLVVWSIIEKKLIEKKLK